MWTRTASGYAEPPASRFERAVWRGYVAGSGRGRVEDVDSSIWRAPCSSRADLAFEAAGVGEVDRQRVVVVGASLRRRGGGPGDGDSRSTPGRSRRRRVTARDGSECREKAVLVGLVVDLARGVAEAVPGRRELAEEVVSSWRAASPRSCRAAAQVGLQLLGRDLRARRQVALARTRRRGDPDRASLIFAPSARSVRTDR